MKAPKQLVEINLHGVLGEQLHKKKWSLDVKSVSEASHAINAMSNNLFYKTLLQNDKKGIKYAVLINKRSFLSEKPLTENNLEDIENSELVMPVNDLKTIDIVPVIEGAGGRTGDWLLVIVGIILVIVGFKTFGATTKTGFVLIMAGLGLVATGVMNLLTEAPKLSDFKSKTARGSFLFDGPENVIGEGGPVPLLYGQLIVGSQTISATYHVEDQRSLDYFPEYAGFPGGPGGAGGAPTTPIRQN